MIIKSFATTILTALIIILSATAASFAQEAPPPNDDLQTEAPLPENTMRIRIGVVLPKANFAASGVSSAQTAASVREIIAEYFKNSEVEIVALDARLPQAIADEADAKSCFYILQTTLSRKRNGDGAANSMATLFGKNTANTLYTANHLASTTKSKDEFTFEYNLISTDDDSSKAKNSFKVKAKSDGEDVLSPLLEKMKTAVLAVAK